MAQEPAVQRTAAAKPSAEPPTNPAAPGVGGKLTSEELDKLVQKVGLALNLDPNLIKAVIKAESNFDHKAVSRAGAQGLMQLMPGTARELGVKDPFNPVENVWGGARYLKKMLDRHSGNINNALASYNWGPGTFDRHGKTRLPGETKRYIAAVNKNYAQFKQSGASAA
jgi:soluble lytic murein transglycosylase-like protein